MRKRRCQKTGVVDLETWEKADGTPHNPDGPAITERDRTTGVVTRLTYMVDGKVSREGGEPASAEFDPQTGQCVFRTFCIDGQFGREDGLPDVEHLDEETGVVVRAEYCVAHSRKGRVCHREDGPALITYDRLTGVVTGERYFINGRERSPILRSDFDEGPV